MDTIGASVKCGVNSRYSVFEPMNDTSKKAIVLVNFDNTEDEIEVNIVTAKNGKAELCIPFLDDRVLQLPSKIKVPARTCAVLVQNN
jgi:hypothetical protein